VYLKKKGGKWILLYENGERMVREIRYLT